MTVLSYIELNFSTVEILCMLLGVHSFKLCSEIFNYARRTLSCCRGCIFMHMNEIDSFTPSFSLSLFFCLSVSHTSQKRQQQSTDREAQSEKLIYSWTADLAGTLSVSDPHAVNRFLSFLLSSRSSTRNVRNEEKKNPCDNSPLSEREY